MPRLRLRWLIPVLAATFMLPVAGAAAQPDDAGRPFPGTRTEPWVWVAEFFGNAFWHGLDATGRSASPRTA